MIAWLLLAAPVVVAADPTETRRYADERTEPPADLPKPGFSFLGLVQARTTVTDVITTNPLLDGQLVGALGGSNQTTTSDEALAVYSEQRVVGFLTYRPPLLDGRAALTAAFEVDFGFGDSAYGTGGNRGGGFGADQVNLQTRRVHADVRVLARPRHTLDLRLGLQFVADGARDPVGARPDDLFRAGGGLALWGSEAAGGTLFGAVRDASGVRLRYRLGGYTLWEQGSAKPDDTTLFVADVEWLPSHQTSLGLHAWYLNDDSGGVGGVLGVGPTSALAGLQGAPQLDFRLNPGDPAPLVNADVVWVGVSGAYNSGLGVGRLGARVGLFGNLGRLTVVDVGWSLVRGLWANGEVRYRWARGRGSIVRLEGVLATGDDPDTTDYEGVLTGNAWGTVGAVYGTHGAVLLHPDVGAVNRQVAAAYDVSMGGRGMLGGQLGFAWDVVPDRLNVGATVAHASRWNRSSIGTEVNLRLSGEILPFLQLGAVGAVLPGSGLQTMPWTAYGYLQWVVF
jgi:hypothetical protein